MMVEKMWTWSDYREYWYRRVFETREEAMLVQRGESGRSKD